MSTLLVAAIVIASIILFCLIFIYINKKNESKQKEKFLNLFKEAGFKYDLSFSRQEVLRNKIIGLDSLKRTLLVFEFAPVESVICINMAEIKNCTVAREYENVNIGTEKKSKIEKDLRSIVIQLDFINSVDPVSVSFYDSGLNSVYEMTELESKAKQWVSVLSKMIERDHKARA
ncbi:MAG TPA: hypothetical protein VH396_16005 [Chitinophagaceae bacterium]